MNIMNNEVRMKILVIYLRSFLVVKIFIERIKENVRDIFLYSTRYHNTDTSFAICLKNMNGSNRIFLVGQKQP